MAEIKKYLNLEGLTEVAEKVNQKLRIVTTMPSTPEANDIVKYNGTTTAKYKQGCTYLYTIVETYYKWSDSTDNYYTKTPSPKIGDTVYSDTLGTDSGYTIEAYDNINNQVTINSSTYDRDATGDTPVYDWVNCSTVTSGYSPSFLDDSLVFTFGMLPEVDGNALLFDLDGN